MKTSEIRFRGQKLNSEEFIDGYFMKNQHGEYFIVEKLWTDKEGEMSTAKPSITCHIVKPETVGQFTGRQDKNGVDLFSGDIISGEWLQEDQSYGYDNLHEFEDVLISYSPEYQCFTVPTTIDRYIKRPLCNYLNFMSQVDWCEKIGTKFDNKTK